MLTSLFCYDNSDQSEHMFLVSNTFYWYVPNGHRSYLPYNRYRLYHYHHRYNLHHVRCSAVERIHWNPSETGSRRLPESRFRYNARWKRGAFARIPAIL